MKWFEKYYNLSQKNYNTGLVSVDHSLCTGCAECGKICPATALEIIIINNKKKSRMKKNSDCISCGACTAVCKPRAITIERFWNIPDGAYKTVNRNLYVGRASYPRVFKQKE